MQSQIAKAYDKYAKQYADYLEQRLPQYLLTKFISLLPAKAVVLDAGCAAGRDSAYLAEEGFAVKGIDISKEILKIARKRAKEETLKIVFKNNSLCRISYKDSTFHGIWCLDTFNHTSRKDIRETLKELCRVLKKDGILAISALEGKKEGMEQLEYIPETVFCAEHNQPEIEEELRNAGFNIIYSSFDQPDGEVHINIFARKL
ncbi:MAG: class I SAM-dependent methyltransferase [Nanoarchaeota archaeon]|nr:class I SAM-dependent methyltransferase [Nanoarchaeota archaeon]